MRDERKLERAALALPLAMDSCTSQAMALCSTASSICCRREVDARDTVGIKTNDDLRDELMKLAAQGRVPVLLDACPLRRNDDRRQSAGHERHGALRTETCGSKHHRVDVV